MNSIQRPFKALLVAIALLLAGCAGTPHRESFGERIDDSVITTKVKALYVDDPTVSALRINVETFKGVVQLSGFATNVNEINRAIELARSVKGVETVRNDILLKTAAR